MARLVRLTFYSVIAKQPVKLRLRCELCNREFDLEDTVEAEAQVTRFGRPNMRKADKLAPELRESASTLLEDKRKSIVEVTDMNTLPLVGVGIKTQPCPECGFIPTWMEKAKKTAMFMLLAIGLLVGAGAFWVWLHPWNNRVAWLVAAIPLTLISVAFLANSVKLMVSPNPNEKLLANYGKSRDDLVQHLPLDVSFGDIEFREKQEG